MTGFGYTMMCEQSRPDQLVADVAKAEQAGFDFSVISDHFQPWLAEQGHSGYAWSILGAAAQATEKIGLMTYVTCPTVRYHPAIVAQKAATMQILSGNRFRLGLGAGENLNEHVVGQRWPAVGLRHELLSEAVDIISALFDGDGMVNYRGRHFDVEQAKLWDLPERRVPIGIAVSGEDSCQLAGRKADLMIAVQPEAGSARCSGRCWRQTATAGGAGRAGLLRRPRGLAVRRAHQQFQVVRVGLAGLRRPPQPGVV